MNNNIRVTTRRARACNPFCVRDGDIAIAQTDQGELDDLSPLPTEGAIVRAIVVCTSQDLGDPRFRLWLYGSLITRMSRQVGDAPWITLEMVSSPADVEEST